MLYRMIYEVITYSEEMAEYLEGYFNAQGVVILVAVAFAIKAIGYIVYYSFRAAALYKMAKRQGEKKAWLAFIPCACFFLLGKLQDDSLPSSKRNAFWTYTAIITSSIYLAASVLLEIFGTIPTLTEMFSVADDVPILSSFIVYTPLTRALNMLMSFANLAFAISCVILYMNVYRAFAPSNAFKYSIISVAVDILLDTPILYAIFLFVIRNNDKISFAEYTRAQSEFFRGYGRYGNNYYGEGDRRNYYGGNAKREKQEEPFEEFSSSDEPFTDNDGNSFGGKENGNYGKSSEDGSDDLFS